MRKFFKPITIGSASALIAVTSFFSYAIGLIRDRVIAVNFGTSSSTDVYNASFLIPDLLFNLFIAGALAAAFLPVFSQYLAKNKEEGFQIANTMITAGTIIIGLLSVLAFIFADHLVPFMFPEATPDAQVDIIHMTRFMLPSAFLFTISNTLGNILMSYKHFLAYSLSPIFYNLGIILGIILFKDTLGIYAAATGVIAGAVLHTLIRIADIMSTEYRYRPSLKFGHPGLFKIFKLMVPRTIGLIAWQVNLYIFAVVGIKIMEGGLAAFHFARNIQSFAVSLVGISFATAVFPYLAGEVTKGNFKEYTRYIQKTMQRILFFTIPAMLGVMTLSDEIVNVILGGGIFDKNSVTLTSIILFYFAISIPFESMVHILARAFYALQNTFTPMLIALFAMSLMALSTIYLAPKYGIRFFSIGFSMAFAIHVLLLILFLKKKLESFNYQSFLRSLAKTILASGIMVIVILISEPLGTALPHKMGEVLRILIGAASFFFIAFLIKSEEISSINYILARIFKKPNNETIK